MDLCIAQILLTGIQISDTIPFVRCNNFTELRQTHPNNQEALMAAKPKKKTETKKAAAMALNSKPAVSNVTAFTKGFPQFQQFQQFQPFKMETSMFKGNKQAEKMAQDAAAMGQQQMDAIMKSTTIFTKGMEDIIKTCMEIAQDCGEKNSSLAKTMMSCKTLNEFTEAQARLAQTSFDEFMTNATKISEMSVKLCTECMEPINSQMGKAMKRSNMAA